MEKRLLVFKTLENQSVEVRVTHGSGIFCKGGGREILDFDMTVTHFYCSCWKIENEYCISFGMNDFFALQRGDFVHSDYNNIIPLTAFKAMPKSIKNLQLRIWGV